MNADVDEQPDAARSARWQEGSSRCNRRRCAFERQKDNVVSYDRLK